MDLKNLYEIYEKLGISRSALDLAAEAERALQERFQEIDRIAEYNQAKVLHAMQKNKVNDNCFAATTCCGYNDLGR